MPHASILTSASMGIAFACLIAGIIGTQFHGVSVEIDIVIVENGTVVPHHTTTLAHPTTATTTLPTTAAPPTAFWRAARVAGADEAMSVEEEEAEEGSFAAVVGTASMARSFAGNGGNSGNSKKRRNPPRLKSNGGVKAVIAGDASVAATYIGPDGRVYDVIILEERVEMWFTLITYRYEDVNTGTELANAYYSRGDFGCDSVYDMLTASFAIGVFAAFAALVSSVIAALRACVEKIPRALLVATCGITLVTSVASFSLSISVFNSGRFGHVALSRSGFYLGWGLSVLVCGAVMSFFGMVLAVAFADLHRDKDIVREILEGV